MPIPALDWTKDRCSLQSRPRTSGRCAIVTGLALPRFLNETSAVYLAESAFDVQTIHNNSIESSIHSDKLFEPPKSKEI